MKHSELDEIYDAIDAMMKRECWGFIDEVLVDKTRQVWRTELDKLLAFATATLPAKSKLAHRPSFIAQCKSFFPDPELWKGLE